MTCTYPNCKPALCIALEGSSRFAHTAQVTRFAALFALMFGVLSPAYGADRGVTVFAAASLRGALEDIAEGFDGDVRLSFGGSGTIARQVAAGAPADVVVLANAIWMDWLAEQGALHQGTPIDVAGNALVLIAPAATPPLEQAADLPRRLGTSRLAMGQRDAVPAGSYTRQWLEAAGLWPDVQNRLAETDNVRAALALVAREETPIGVVYATDAQAEDRVDVIWTVPSDLHDSILYPAAALTPAGQEFLNHLTSPDAAQIFAAHGFLPVQR